MEHLQQIAAWFHAPAFATVDSRTLVAMGFVGFNGFRVLLHVPQLLTCLRDPYGCSTINLWTWGGLVAASVSTALYMGLCLGDVWGVALNLGNAAMCAATVCITWFKRRRARGVPLLFIPPARVRADAASAALP